MDPKSPRVLLVEDDHAVLATYVRALCEYAPLQAADGIAAIKILSETEVDVVLCDLEMPRMNGLDLMRWAKQHCPYPLFIVVSGRGTFDAAAEALKLGAFDFICKPVQSPIELQTVVANAARHQAIVAERAQLVRSLENANAVLRNQQTMIEQDLRRAELIVRALLPRALGSIGQMHVNVAYRPNKSIGGDFFGAAMLDERHLAVYVADAAGHGVSAALLAVLFNQRLSAFSAETGPRTPATVLAALNRALFEECRASGLFVTTVYALIDTMERTATLASAGHPPGLLLRSTGLSQQLEKTGPALGLRLDASYGEHRLSLADGDRVLLYTDGLTSAISEQGAQLDAILRPIAGAEEAGTVVIDRLLACTERADDDITMLLLTASIGASTVDADQASIARTAPTDCALSIGAADGTTWVVIRGRATWKDATVLRDTCIEALEAGRSVVIDFASCSLLDSTILGTLHDLVVRAEPSRALRLQNAGDDIRGLFAELAMTQVLSSIAPTARFAPAGLSEIHAGAETSARGLILHAHELLAELSASNAQQFQPVIDALKHDAAR